MLGRPVKSLSEQQVADLRAGRGMGLALPAELNGYPGPMHVLEHAATVRCVAMAARARPDTRAGMDSTGTAHIGPERLAAGWHGAHGRAVGGAGALGRGVPPEG